MNSKNEQRAVKLADEMKNLLEKWILQDGPECEKAMHRIAEIKQEINSFGFFVDWKVLLDLENPDGPKATAEVNLGKPKPNMTPEEQLIYDLWFKKVNGME